MLVQLSHHEWQLLRAAVRAELAGQPSLAGRELRMAPTRMTKDGTFLDRLVAEGLLAVAAKPPAGPEGEPAQFRTRYKLTAKGREAAEYGEFDRAYTPTEQPLVGAAAALFEQKTRAKGKPRQG